MSDRRLTVASWLCLPFAVYAMVAPFALLLPSHAFDKSWPPHARFHLYWASGKLFAVGTTQFFMARFGLPSGNRWTWFALLSNVLFGGLSIIPASRLAHGPILPFRSHDRSTKFAVMVFVSTIVGLVLAVPAVFACSKAKDNN